MIRVLIVDDSSLAREFHAHILKDAGFVCVTAVDGMEGLEKATAEKFHIILTDINMQGMDGYEFIRRARQTPDYDEVRLEMARRAVYEERSVREIPPEYFDRHIARLPAGYFAVKPETAKLVDIQHLNLHDRLAMRAMRQFDFIFCRNVLIYFDDASRKAVVDHFYNALKPGGFIFLGHSESVGRISTAFQLLRLGQNLVYRKE